MGATLCCLRFILPQIPQISQILYIPVSVFICAICGKLLRPRYPCSSAISVGAILCILRLFSHRFHGFSKMHLEIVLPQIPQIFTDFIYPRIRVHLCYLWEILSHPISVFICDICGSHPLLLEIYSPTDSTDIHRFYISYVLSVRDSFLRCICGNLTKSIAIDFSNDTIINVICIEINKDTDMLFGEAKISKQLLMMYWF